LHVTFPPPKCPAHPPGCFVASFGDARRLHSFKLELDSDAAPVVWYREHDSFDKYRGDSGKDDAVGLRVFKAPDGKCVLEAVDGVRLVYNDQHPDVNSKVKHLKQVLDRFGQADQAPPLAVIQDVGANPDNVRMGMVADLIQRRGHFAKYFKDYDDSMAKMKAALEAGEEPRAAFQLARLPPQASALAPAAKMLAAMLESASRTAASSSGVDLNASFHNRSTEAARQALAHAAKVRPQCFSFQQHFLLSFGLSHSHHGTSMFVSCLVWCCPQVHLDSAGSREAYMPEQPKQLRYLRKGDKRTDRDWTVGQTKQGDMVLCELVDEPYWGLGIALPPTGRNPSECDKTQPALFDSVVDVADGVEPSVALAWLDAPPSGARSGKRTNRDTPAQPESNWEQNRLNLFKSRGSVTITTIPAASVVFSFRSQGNWKWKIPEGAVRDKVLALTEILASRNLAEAHALAGEAGQEEEEDDVRSEEEDADVIDAQAEEEPLLGLV